MGKFVITEEERKRIKSLYINESTFTMVNSDFPESSKVFSCVAINKADYEKWYKNNDGTEYVTKIYPSSQQLLYSNGTATQATRDGKTITKRGTWKCENNKPVFNWNDSSNATSTSSGNTNDEIYKYDYPGDTVYKYGVKDGKWWAKYLPTGQEVDLTSNPKWNQSIENLNIKFPEAIKDVSTQSTSGSNLSCIKIDTAKGDVKNYYAGAKMWFVRKYYDKTYDVYWENNTYQTFGKDSKKNTHKGTWRCNSSEPNGFSIVTTQIIT